jgi:hypothetical protein
MPDRARKDNFSSGFIGLDEAGKTYIEKILSNLSEQPHSPELVSPCKQETPSICIPAANVL